MDHLNSSKMNYSSSPNRVGDFGPSSGGRYARCQGGGFGRGPGGASRPWAENISLPFPPTRLGEEPFFYLKIGLAKKEIKEIM
jgi:hypothetical protein